MANIRRPQNQQNSGLEKLGSVVEMGEGIASLSKGNPVGALKVAGGAKGLQNKSDPQAVGGESAVQRRLSQMAPQPQMKGDDILKTLQDGQVAFNQLPPEQKKEYAEPFFKTYSSFAKDYKQGRFS
jgi:hypothetical protein